MEKVYGLKNVPYASDGAAGTVDRLADAKDLEAGAIGFYNEAGDLIEASADALDCKDFFIAANIGGDIRISKGIERANILRVEQKAYVAPVMHKVVVGGTTSSTGFTIDSNDVGDVIVRVADNTFSGMFATNSIVASVYKKASMTVEQVVDALVTKLNANTNVPVTAVKVKDGTDTYFGITIESKTRGQFLTVSLQGLIEGNQIINDGTSVSVLPVYGEGVGEDAWQDEFEASMYLGNSNSAGRHEDFYKAPYGVDKAGTYSTLIFQEELRKPYIGETNVKPLYTFYVPSDEDTDLMTTILGVLEIIVGGRYLAASNVEPGNDNDPGTTVVP
jgi:hypothetical protein